MKIDILDGLESEESDTVKMAPGGEESESDGGYALKAAQYHEKKFQEQ